MSSSGPKHQATHVDSHDVVNNITNIDSRTNIYAPVNNITYAPTNTYQRNDVKALDRSNSALADAMFDCIKCCGQQSSKPNASDNGNQARDGAGSADFMRFMNAIMNLLPNPSMDPFNVTNPAHTATIASPGTLTPLPKTPITSIG